ncbi:hypothetical protein BofuT4_P023530.1 [Botrytis cinerea T4]|uniref:Uncharacterized protein n=1 Tax=Botryotinia fuckeliana (strain T4) TaxID=999810 RepID=G2YH51_BOTF4|nr:hypothetical protein BofuT4_P023530.1 [Botrytis cinerea T4]
MTAFFSLSPCSVPVSCSGIDAGTDALKPYKPSRTALAYEGTLFFSRREPKFQGALTEKEEILSCFKSLLYIVEPIQRDYIIVPSDMLESGGEQRNPKELIPIITNETTTANAPVYGLHTDLVDRWKVNKPRKLCKHTDEF